MYNRVLNDDVRSAYCVKAICVFYSHTTVRAKRVNEYVTDDDIGTVGYENEPLRVDQLG